MGRSRLLSLLALFFIFVILIISYGRSLPDIHLIHQEGIIDNLTGDINYIISSKFTSKGAFVVNEEVEAIIEIKALKGDLFGEDSLIELWIGKIGEDIYRSPLEMSNGIYLGPSIDKGRVISEDGKTFTGTTKILFQSSKVYNIYTIHLKTTSGKEYAWVSSKTLRIEGPHILSSMKQERTSTIALLIAFVGVFFTIIVYLKK